MEKEIIRLTAEIFGIIGAAIIIYGGIRAAIGTLKLEVLKKPLRYGEIRREFTFKIVFGLEFFIAADVLKTLISPSQEEILLLGAVVGIRIVLGYFLTKETELLKE
jgi:uncharacterized membrane protein